MQKLVTLHLDETDYCDILNAVARYQRETRVANALILPDCRGESDLRSRILAQICRAWADYRDQRSSIR